MQKDDRQRAVTSIVCLILFDNSRLDVPSPLRCACGLLVERATLIRQTSRQEVTSIVVR